MKQLQRHWRLVTVGFCVALLGTGLLTWQNGDVGVALAYPEGDYDPIEDPQRDAVLGLLDHAALDRDALIALNVTALQAESLLAGTRTWQAANAAALAAQQASIDQARAQVRQLRGTIAMGPYQEGNDTALATAVQQYLAAQAAYMDLLGPLKTALQADLSESQVATWNAIAAGHGQSQPIRMLAFSDAQRLDFSRARRQYRRQFAAASTDEERSEAVAAWTQAQAQILTQDQETVVSAFYSYHAESSAAVGLALAIVLPAA